MMKIERLLNMTIILLNRRKVTAKELAEKFDITVRTVYRDVETLNASGIPVISYQGYEGGFCIAENFKLSKQLLTFDDITSLLSLLNGVNNTLQNREVDSVIEKITALIPDDREEEYRSQSDSFIIDLTPWGKSSESEKRVTLIHKAVSDSQKISFFYTSAHGAGTERIVEPHSLVMKNFSWYLLAFCTLRKEFRVFKLVRIHELTTVDERFVRRPVDPHDYFQPAEESRHYSNVELSFKASMRYKIQEMFSEDMYEVQEDGSILASFSMPIDDWVVSMILGYGENVKVLSPNSLKETIKDKINSLQQLYSH